jgi:hypothetical protein
VRWMGEWQDEGGRPVTSDATKKSHRCIMGGEADGPGAAKRPRVGDEVIVRKLTPVLGVGVFW